MVYDHVQISDLGKKASNNPRPIEYVCVLLVFSRLLIRSKKGGKTAQRPRKDPASEANEGLQPQGRRRKTPLGCTQKSTPANIRSMVQ